MACPAGFGQRRKDTSWEGIPGVPDCSEPIAALRRCRESVARKGKGHCMVEVRCATDCERARDAVRSSVLGECGKLHAQLVECGEAGAGGAACAGVASSFARCAAQAIAK